METRISRAVSPSLQGMGDPVGTMIREAARDDENAGVKVSGLEPGDGEPDEVIPVPRHQDTAFGGREAELLGVGVASAVDLMDGDRIETETPGDLGHRGVEILVEKKPHRRRELSVAGLREGQLGADPLRW